MASEPAYLLYRLNNLPKTNVVQKAYVGATYVYALQLYDANTNVVISRVPKASATDTYDLDFSGANAEHMYLLNMGHGQTFEYFTHKGLDYWWIVTKGDGTTENWGTQVGRIQFEANTEASTPYNGNTTITRLSSVSSATTSGSAYGKIHRVEAALSTTNDSNRLLLIAGIDTDLMGHFTLYDNEKVNNLLDTVDAEHGNYSCGDLTSALASDPIREIKNITNGALLNDSVQGFDISDGRAIYISGGQAKGDDHATQDTPAISKYYWGTESLVQNSLYNTNWSSQNIETEGVQISSDLYVGISYHQTMSPYSTEQNRIYRTDKSLWDE